LRVLVVNAGSSTLKLSLIDDEDTALATRELSTRRADAVGERRADVRPQARDERAADRAFADAWRSDSPAFAVINFANADMVGHTGVIDATISGVETVDRCIGEVIRTVHSSGGVCVITADHGNAEQMLDEEGGPSTAHSTNPVPLVVTRAGLEVRPAGTLGDVAPTVLQLLGIDQPAAMTGRSLIESVEQSRQGTSCDP
jgi:2,3-bisphosphoglycerate-independent phosphoglycerate mutase